jgi:hypothetical protein
LTIKLYGYIISYKTLNLWRKKMGYGGFGGFSGFGGIGLGILPIVGIILVVVIILAIAGRGKGLGVRGIHGISPVLVLKEFKLNVNEDEFLIITGRATGFWSWVKSLFGFDQVTSLRCNKQSIKYSSGGNTLHIPNVAITGVSSGINQPFILLILGIIIILFGLIGVIAMRSVFVFVFILCLIIGIIFILLSRKKTMQFSIHAGENFPLVLISVKGSDIDIANCELAASTLNKAVLDICKN